jgi:hypothetical protein
MTALGRQRPALDLDGGNLHRLARRLGLKA